MLAEHLNIHILNYNMPTAIYSKYLNNKTHLLNSLHYPANNHKQYNLYIHYHKLYNIIYISNHIK